MNKRIILLVFLLIGYFQINAQKQTIEFGLGTKYDVFKIQQSGQVFERNFDLGAIAFISYGRNINKKLNWEAGLATNNYKLNFKVKGDSGLIFSNRELVSVMRSNRIYFNLIHLSKNLTPKISWVNSVGISLLIGAKNPYDVILQRGKEIETAKGTQSVDIKIKTYGLTGSAILLGAGTKLYYQLNKDFKLAANLSFVTGMGQLTKVDVNYVFGSNTDYKKAVFSTNGFAPMFTFGAQYGWGE